MKRIWAIAIWMLPLAIWAGSVSVTNDSEEAISDNSCFDKTFDISISSAITKVTMEVYIDHTWRADLDITLTSPAGTAVDLTSDNGGSKNNLRVLFDDAAATSITDDNSNHNGGIVDRSPEQALSAFNGEDPSGIWTLTVCDDAGGDTGTYYYGTLTVYNNDPETPPLIDPVPSYHLVVNQNISIDLSDYVAETDGDPILSYRLDGTLPAGLSFDSATAVISGTPSSVETQTMTLYATDNDGESSGESFDIKIYPQNVPKAEYRMDECFWFNSSTVSGDVRDSSPFGSNATSIGAIATTEGTTNPPVCNYGTFGATGDRIEVDDSSVMGGDLDTLTISAWIYPVDGDIPEWVGAVMRTSDEQWNDGFGFANNASDNSTIKFFVNGVSNAVSATLDMNTWNHIVGVYDGNTIKIYKNGTEVGSISYSNTVTGVTPPLYIGNDLADQYDDKWLGSIDEVKVWDRPLSASEVSDIYNNESNGLNYDGSVRICNTCSATAHANTWELIGIPADLRSGDFTVEDLFADDTSGTYGTDWYLFGRGYSDTNNSSWYNYLDLNSTVMFGQGYWLYSKQDMNWDVNDIPDVIYDSGSTGCVTTRCVEIDVKSVSLDESTDDLQGTGPYRYNLSGAIGKKPVNWADCRILIDGAVYTPSDAETAGYMSKQIWLYNPADSGANGNGYTTCDDTTPGGCQLIPYKGFWIQLKGPTKGKSVKLLIPEG